LDRFHIVAKLNKVLDNIRRAEAKKLKDDGKPAYLKKSRWLFLNLKLLLKIKRILIEY